SAAPDDDLDRVDIVVPLPSDRQILPAATEPEEAKTLSEDFLAALVGMVPVSPDLLRATRAGDAFQGFGKALRGSKKLYQNSAREAELQNQEDQYVLESQLAWLNLSKVHDSPALLQRNSRGSRRKSWLGCGIRLFALQLLPVVHEPTSSKDAYWQSFWASLLGIILYVLILLFYRPQVPIFLDVICIDQVNAKRKGFGLLSMGAFLKASRSMLVLWDATYCDRLWTMFEVAAFLQSREQGEMPNVVLRPTILGPCYLVLMLTLLLVLTIGDNVAYALSANGRYVVWAFQFLICCIGLSVNTIPKKCWRVGVLRM
ncbi:unnamed protein product, partial [Symbiodinium sp. KB8]